MKGEGRWTLNEHTLFLEALVCFKSWNHVAKYVKTRSPAQCRSHNQKMLCKERKANLRIDQAQLKNRSSNKRDASTQWDDSLMDYYKHMPVFEMEKTIDLMDSSDSNAPSALSTGDESSSSRFEPDYSGDLIFSTICTSLSEISNGVNPFGNIDFEHNLVSVSALPNEDIISDRRGF